MMSVLPETVGDGRVDLESLLPGVPTADEPQKPTSSETAFSDPRSQPPTNKMEPKPLPDAPTFAEPRRGIDCTIIFGLLLLPITWPLVIVSVVLSWPLKIMINFGTCRYIGGCVMLLMGPLLILFLELPAALVGAWGFLMQCATELELSVIRVLLLYLPWPKGSDCKLFHCARSRQMRQVERMTGLKDLEPETEKVRRRFAVACWRNLNFTTAVLHSDNQRGHLKEMVERGGDVNFPNAGGKSFLYEMTNSSNGPNDVDAVDFLLSEGADPNVQDGQGYAPLHIASSETIYTTLRNFDGSGDIAGTDLSLMSNKGKTPYMKQGAKRTYFQPNPSWQELNQVLDAQESWKPEDIPDLCDRIIDLIARKNGGCRSPRLLCVLDVLFCEHEGDCATLRGRRLILFQKFLRPAMSRSVEGSMDKARQKLLIHVYKGMEGPPDCKDARYGFEEDYKKALDDACSKIEGMYGAARDDLLESPVCAELFDNIPKKMEALDELELQRFPSLTGITNKDVMFHGRFTAPPKFAFSKSLSEAALELQRVGAMESAAAFCDLMQQGRHRFLQTARPKLFRDRSSIEFWQALVMLWSLGLQEQLLEAFNAEMQSIAVGAELKTAPLKGFDRSFEKAVEYASEKGLKAKGWNAEVLAPLHVIDQLRCSFIVDTLESNLEIGQLLQAKFPTARTKNTHKRENASYADRKFNVVFQNKGVAFICEIQLLMRRYIEIKEFGHLIYEFVR